MVQINVENTSGAMVTEKWTGIYGSNSNTKNTMQIGIDS